MSAASSSQSIQRSRTQYWIVSWWQDLLWFVATPLLLIPIFVGLQQSIPLDRLSLLIVSFGAVGHHLPGMIRAYGDAELFERYKVRFTLTPIFLFGVSVAFSFYRPDTLRIVILTWGMWHSQAQVYGFLRIYDSKVGNTSHRDVMLDRLLCLSWFAGGILMSSGRMTDLLTTYYKSGGAIIAPGTISVAQNAMLIVMAVSAVAYGANAVIKWRLGHPPSPVKWFTLLISIGFWWYCMVFVNEVVLGIALYEVFHDVQYLAIVWHFNQRRVETSAAAGWLTKALFRPRVALVLTYLGLILLYGSGSLFTRSLEHSALQTVLTGFFAASGLLHFYYDGFIWRLREKSTGDSLGIKSSTGGPTAVAGQLSRWLPQAGLWSAFSVPLIVFSLTPATRDVYAKVAQTLPGSVDAQCFLSKELQETGALEEAEEVAGKVVRLEPGWGKGWARLGEIQLARGEILDAAESLNTAVAADPLDATALFNLGSAYLKLGRVDEGTEALFEATQYDSKLETRAFNNLGAALLERGARDEAAGAFQQAVEADPTNVMALTNLAAIKLENRDLVGAWELYAQAVGQRTPHAPAYQGAVETLIRAERLPTAIQLAREFVEIFPSDPAAFCALGLAQSTAGQHAEALAAFEHARSLDSNHFASIYGSLQVLLKTNRNHESRQLIASLQNSSLPESQQAALRKLLDHATRDLSEDSGDRSTFGQ